MRDLLGRRSTLLLRRIAGPGAFLSASDDDDVILLPRRDVPATAKPGDALDVFVYLDSDDQPIATTTSPLVARDRVAFLEVRDVAPFGAFVDWGLPKDLLVPKAELLRDVRVGDRHPIAVYVDDTGRLAGTMRVTERLTAVGVFETDEWVEGEAWRKEPGLGVFVIVEQRFVGLLPEAEPHRLARGSRARFRVAHVHQDGKIELSLRAHAHEQRDADADAILAVLGRPGTPAVSDGSSPELVRSLFGLSKKAFKRAVGGLLKKGVVRLDADGRVVASTRPTGLGNRPPR